ncbi:MAG: GNAT family N-acetyltransferase [Alphaproteobacteria bacterium]
MDIRKANDKDLTVLAMMYRQLRIDANYRTVSSLVALEEKMRRFITQDGWIAHLFENEQGVVGYCLWQERSDAVYIRQFWIMRPQRRQGHGRHFFDELKNKFWCNKRLKLEVLYHNQRGESFWRALGFSPYAITLECNPDNNLDKKEVQ